MEQLKASSFDGHYSNALRLPRRVGVHPPIGQSHFAMSGLPRLCVRAEDGEVWLDVGVHSKTQVFTRRVNLDDLETILDELESVQAEGDQMVETLKALE